MKNFVAFLLLIISTPIYSQNLKGTVCQQKDREPVQFGTVALLQLPDSSMVTGVITLTDGSFMLENVKPGKYFVKATYVGLHSGGKEVTVENSTVDIPVDTIFLAETTANLSEITVTAERIKGKEMVDRTVYAIPEAVAKSSTTGYDLLKKVPQVNVDYQNNVTLNGSSNFIIQVDGRQRDREFLARLLPSDIESIEVISNPSGKYEGNIDGVLNIILKKEARYGVNGNVSLMLKPFNKVTEAGTGSIDYAMGKITFYVTAVHFSQRLDISSSLESRFTAIDSTTSMTSNGGIKVASSSVQAGFDYYMNEKNNLSLNLSYKPIGQDIDLSGETFLFKSAAPENTISSLIRNDLKSDETSGSLFYKRTFKTTAEEFTAEANYYHFISNSGNDFTNVTYPYNSSTVISTDSRQEDNYNARDYFSAKLNFSYPIGMDAKVEAGYQMYYQKMKYQFTINDVTEDNLFRYGELRNSVYGGVTFNLKKVGFQTVLRAENSFISADSVTDKAYTCLLPSVNLQYKFSASHNLKLTYNRRINRPGIYDMDPYYKVGQNYDISQGNPNLKPDYRDRVQMTYTWNFGSNYLSPYVYTEYFTNKVGTRYMVTNSPVDGRLTTMTKPFNLLNGYEAGGGLNATLWVVNINAQVYKGHINAYTGQSVNIPAKDYFSYTISGVAYKSFGKDKKFTAFAFASYNGVSTTAESKTYSLPFYGPGMQAQLKNHSFQFVYVLPFSGNVKINRTVTETPYYTSTQVIGADLSAFIQFTYSYKFNKGKSIKKIDHKVEVESDSKSQAIGK